MILRRWLASVRTRLRGAAAEQELDDELRTHLELAVEENYPTTPRFGGWGASPPGG